MSDQNENAQPMVIGPMGQPVYPTVAVTSPSSTTTRVKPTKGYMQSIEDQKAAAQAEEDAINYGVNVDTNIAAAQKGIFDSALVAEQARIKARADAMASWNTRIGEARKQLDERIQQASAEPTSYWADRTEGERTQARIGSWLSAFGAAITGGDNLALKKISENIERDIKVKQAKSERLFKLAEQSRGLLADSYRAKAEELGDMDAQRAAAWQVVAKQMESVKLGFLPAEKRAEADQKIALVQQKAAQALQEAEKNLETKVVSDSGHTVTTLPAPGTAGSKKSEAEQKMNLLGQSMLSELEAIDNGPELTNDDLTLLQKNTLGATAADKKAESGPFSSAIVSAERAIGIVPKSRYEGLSPEKQKVANAWDNSVEKYTRLLTGAGMPVDEARRMAQQNMPVPEDTPAVVKFKRDRLEREANRMVALSQNAAAATAAPNAKRPAGVSANAAPAPQMSPLQMAREARARLKVNPNDKVARETLQYLENMDVTK